jgi:hypothetical protein
VSEPNTTPPIDILRLASDRVSAAREAIRATVFMQAGPKAQGVYWDALVKHDMALRDAQAVQKLALELAELANG